MAKVTSTHPDDARICVVATPMIKRIVHRAEAITVKG